MKQVLRHFLLVTFISLLSACDKDDPINDTQDKLPEYLLKSIVYDNGVAVACSYNSDSLLQSMDYTFQGAGGKAVFNWTGKTLIELYDDRSMYKNVFEYDDEGNVSMMRNIARTGSLPTGYTLEFHYNGSKKIDTLRYFIINEAGKHLKSLSVYHYNSAGDLKEVVTKYDNNIITHTIDAYSPAVSFNPCHYIETTLSENYTVYNLAVMSQLKKVNKLPAKVTRVVKTGFDPSYADKIEENVYTITNYRIDKVVNTIRYPGVPGYNRTIESVYSYF